MVLHFPLFVVLAHVAERSGRRDSASSRLSAPAGTCRGAAQMSVAFRSGTVSPTSVVVGGSFGADCGTGGQSSDSGLNVVNRQLQRRRLTWILWLLGFAGT